MPAVPVAVQFAATGGPFIEADLLVDDTPVATLALDPTASSLNGLLSWENPSGGTHTLTILVLTPEKETFSASVQITVAGTAGGQTPSVQPTSDPGLEAARQRIVQILHDDYGISVTNPPVGKKARYAVTTDPYASAIYYKNWLINLSIYPDGTVGRYIYSLDRADPYAEPDMLKAGDKPIPACRPSGTIKLLVVVVDYGNLGVSKQEALASVEQAVGQINGKYLEASQAVGLQTPILTLKATTAYLSSPPATPKHVLTADLVRSSTGLDPASFDLLVEVDLDAKDTFGLVKSAGTFGSAPSGCDRVPGDPNVWISISQKEQLSLASSDPRLASTLGHEILHTMGYPIGMTGSHEWVCGDGSLPDGADQCDQNNLPTLMLGWTDTDGDGAVEILDSTPYGMTSP